MNYYKVIILEKSYYTAYIKANSVNEAQNRIYSESIYSIDNQNFEQEILSAELIEEVSLPMGRIINV